MGYSKTELKEIFDKWVPINPKARLKEMIIAYVDGVNQYISEALTAAANGDYSLLPIEYLPGSIQPMGLPLEYFSIVKHSFKNSSSEENSIKNKK